MSAPVQDAVEVASVYLHAPFCARRCFYCDFAVDVRRSPDPGVWWTAIESELTALRREGRVRLATPLRTVYVGGGTPSLLGPEAMAGVRRILGDGRLSGDALEWTAEANPESFDRAVADGWRRAGVGRISLGTQSFQEAPLRWMGRLHGADGAERAVRTVREAGFDSVSIDLIFGLPASVPRDWSADLDRVLALDVPHVSLYGLTAESGTPLGRAVRQGRTALAEETRYEEEYLEASERLRAAGYEHYEVSNFARPGHRSRHNGAYWTGVPYLGLGNGAHSYLPPERRWNVRDWSAYEEAVAAGRLPVDDRERVEGASRRLEEIWLGLRTDRGLLWSVDRPASARALGRSWMDRSLARLEGERLVLTPSGWLVLDRLAVDLDEAMEPGASGGIG
ncbi:radical SAM family heme chaperone HemW [Gaopeijia maritima]|uniref:radical SAM family heme chaperone HemW n=1 Tax=Gaopeijia maritima TaxID=3119007 RepID=UPI003246C376